jgi:ribonuclease Z
MKITILGSAAGYPSAHRSHTSIAIEQSNHLVLLDAGEGTSRSFVTFGFDSRRVEKIFVSHTHPDHVMGLPMLLTMMYLDKRDEALQVYFPKEFVKTFERLLEHLHLPSHKLPFELELFAIGEKSVTVADDLSVRMFPTKHLGKVDRNGEEFTASFGYLLRNENKSMVFSSDIQSVEDVSAYSRGVDLLIVESTHIDFADVIQCVREKRIKRTVVTHISPETEGQIETLSKLAHENGVGNLQFAHDGMVITI